MHGRVGALPAARLPRRHARRCHADVVTLRHNDRPDGPQNEKCQPERHHTAAGGEDEHHDEAEQGGVEQPERSEERGEAVAKGTAGAGGTALTGDWRRREPARRRRMISATSHPQTALPKGSP